MESSAVSVNRKSKLLSQSQLESMSQQELIDRITQLEAHNSQLKNVIHKKVKTEDNVDGEVKERKKRKFDFSNSVTDKERAITEQLVSNPSVSDMTSRDNLKLFIETYESLPELWNPSHPNYQNKVERSVALDKLVSVYKKLKPHADRDEVRKKINSLRTNYRKDLKKATKARNETGEVRQPTSWVFYALRFLGECEQSIHTNMDLCETMLEEDIAPCDYPTNQTDLTQSHEGSQSESGYKIYLPSVSSDSLIAPQPQETKDLKYKSPSEKRKRVPLSNTYLDSYQSNYDSDAYPTNQTDDGEFHEMNRYESAGKIKSPSVSSETSLAPQCQQSQSNQQKLLSVACKYLENLQANDEDYELKVAKVWGEKLRSLDPHQKLLAEKAINDVLFEACLGNLHRGSVRINEVQPERWNSSSQLPSVTPAASSGNPMEMRNLANGNSEMQHFNINAFSK